MMVFFYNQPVCDGDDPLRIKCQIADKKRCKGCSKDQKITCKKAVGLSCIDKLQPKNKKTQKKCKCCDYEVSYLCPPSRKSK